MPKKMGVNSKAEAARARKGAVEAERKEKETREKEDQYWRDAEGSKSRAAKKKEEEAEKRAEAAARKAEARRLAEVEQNELEKATMKKVEKKASRVSIPVAKVTEAELRRRREEEEAEMKRKAEEGKKRQSRTAEEEEYERMVLVSNTNRDDSIIEARSVEEAIAQITIQHQDTDPDRHPERRLKASFKAFEEAELPKLKEDKPGLTHTQYKDLIWKLWKKSPDNPLNQLPYFVACSTRLLRVTDQQPSSPPALYSTYFLHASHPPCFALTFSFIPYHTMAGSSTLLFLGCGGLGAMARKKGRAMGMEVGMRIALGCSNGTYGRCSDGSSLITTKHHHQHPFPSSKLKPFSKFNFTPHPNQNPFPKP
ncbi:hypothetical protein RIF29_18583 [Crotalaria pallida]|uniref:Coiled-coil domain-containing protein n=1 Tax=Crotalaria pallida TaxID=3830 RepID=A0AAN9FLE4_CROPI